MTIKDCIDIVDNLKPNQYTIKDKVMWLSFIEEIIINEVLKTHEGYDGRYDNFEGYSEEKLSVTLIVPSPYDRLYTAYLKMKIDEENGETARYNNSMVLYNAYMMEYRKYYNKTHMPLNTIGRRDIKPLRKATVGLSDAEYENIKRDLTYILTEYFSDTVSADKLYDIVKKYMQNNTELFKGKDGADGVDGKDGDKGEQGLPGEPGKDGKDGADGADGEDGYTPQKGIDYFTEEDIEGLNIPDKETVENNDAMLKRLMYYGDASIVPSDASLFSFAVDDETMTASVSSNGVLDEYYELVISGDIVIPYEYMEDGKTYLVTGISKDAFYKGTRITSVRIPASVSRIDENAFWDCFGLKELNIPDGIKRIPELAFSGCVITNIIIPESVEVIDAVAFSQCFNITDVFYKGTKSQWDAIEIGNDNGSLETATIHYEWSDVTKEYVDEKVGDIDTALDNILAIQTSLIGGDTV